MRLLRLASALYSGSLALAWTTYVVPHSSGNDDTPALAAAFSANPKLATDATILFQKGVTYNILTPIKFPYFKNVIVSVQGNLSYAADIKATQAIVASSSYPGHWFQFYGGSNVTLEGSTDPKWGWVDSHGQKWWDAMSTAALRVNRPSGWGIQSIEGGEVKYMKLWQPVAWSYSINGCKDVHIHHNTITAISQTTGFPYNTDGFAVMSTDILFENNNIFNGDDCVVIGSPSSNIHFRNSYCSGSHGLSVSPLGMGGTASSMQNILFENVTMVNSTFAARYKSWPGDTGTARNITWKDITINKVQTPIFVTQNYWDQSLGQKPSSSSHRSIDTFTFQNFQGTIDDSRKDVVPGATGRDVAILDLYQGTAKSIVAKNLHVTTVSGGAVTVMCNSAAISFDVGFTCWNGAFQQTAAGK